MKQTLILVAIIAVISALIMIFTIQYAEPFTFEGELNPNEFAEWPRISQGMVTPVIGKVILQNPDASSPIQKVEMFIYAPEEVLIIYRYFKAGEIYQYIYDTTADRYVRKHLTGEEKIGCMECHLNQIKPGGIKHGI